MTTFVVSFPISFSVFSLYLLTQGRTMGLPLPTSHSTENLLRLIQS